MSWVLFSGLIQILAGLFKGKGSFEDNLAVTGFSLGIPIIILQWSVDFVLFILGPLIHSISLSISYPFELIRQTIFGIWIILTSSIAVKETQKISYLKAFLITIVSFIPVICLSLTYIH